MKNRILILQIISWSLAFILFFIYLLSRLGSTYYVLAICITSFTSFAAIIYGYALFLHPRFFKKVSWFNFILIICSFFAAVVVGRLFIEKAILYPLGDSWGIFNFGRIHLFYDIFSSFFALIIGILFVWVLDSVASQKRELELKRKQAEAELNQLKAQLQPHFLFNSLNNLYYDVYKSLPAVAERIEMLSSIMRYFMEQSPRSKVYLREELNFIQNYLELEKDRLAHPLAVKLDFRVPEGLMIPPMLLMPLVENLFKHGSGRSEKLEEAEINLIFEENHLHFTVTNPFLHPPLSESSTSGVGLQNLRERLILLYNTDFFLENKSKGNTYISFLKIPVYES